jgi:hypothetical protein
MHTHTHTRIHLHGLVRTQTYTNTQPQAQKERHRGTRATHTLAHTLTLTLTQRCRHALARAIMQTHVQSCRHTCALCCQAVGWPLSLPIPPDTACFGCLFRPGRRARAAGAARHDRRDLRHRHPIQEWRHTCPLALICCSFRRAAAQACNGRTTLRRTTGNVQHASCEETTHNRQGPRAAAAGPSARVRTTAPPRAQYPLQYLQYPCTAETYCRVLQSTAEYSSPAL